jgi:homoserine O-acetyltransferase
MVESQHSLLTEVLDIDSLHAVVGLSMGGMQAFESVRDRRRSRCLDES